MNFKLVISALIVALLSGCAHRTADLTLASTKQFNPDLSKVDVRKGKRAEGSDCVVWPLGFIPTGLPNLEDAINNTLESGGGDLIVDQVTYQKSMYFILASTMCYEVEGTVVNTAL